MCRFQSSCVTFCPNVVFVLASTVVKIHSNTKGPEILTQYPDITTLVLGAGTGGTISGVASFLAPRVPGLRVVLADPSGSGLYNKVWR